MRDGVLADDLSPPSGRPARPTPALVLAWLLEQAAPGEVVAVVSLADGADVLVFRTTAALAGWRRPTRWPTRWRRGPTSPTANSSAWRGMVTPSRPGAPSPRGSRRRPPGATRTGSSASSAPRTAPRAPSTCHPHGSRSGGAVDDMVPVDRADAEATIATYTVDRLAYSPSPPIVFAVLDFDGGAGSPWS